MPGYSPAPVRLKTAVSHPVVGHKGAYFRTGFADEGFGAVRYRYDQVGLAVHPSFNALADAIAQIFVLRAARWLWPHPAINRVLQNKKGTPYNRARSSPDRALKMGGEVA